MPLPRAAAVKDGRVVRPPAGNQARNVCRRVGGTCLTAGIATLSEMMEQDAVDLCGARHGRNVDRRGYRWGRTVGKLGFHGGKVAIQRPRVRAHCGAEMALPSWQAARARTGLAAGR